MRVIQVLYNDISSTILISDEETPPFSILAGILPKETLLPHFSFNLVDYVLYMTIYFISEKGYQLKPWKSSCHHAEFLTDTDFTDDIYTTLWSTIKQIPSHNLFAIASNLNAKLEPDKAKFTFNEGTKRHGGILKDLMEAKNFYYAIS